MGGLCATVICTNIPCICAGPYPYHYFLNYIPDKKRNAQLRTVQLSGRSQVIGQFSLYQCKGMPGTAALHVFCNRASKLC